MPLLAVLGGIFLRRAVVHSLGGWRLMKKLWPVAAGFIVAVSILSITYYLGWHARGSREAAKLLEAERQAAAMLEEERKRGDELARQLEEEKQNIKTVTVEVIKEVPKVTKVYVEKPGDAEKPIPPAVITWGAIGVYDRALRPDLPATSRIFTRPSGGSDLARSPADVSDILEVHTINAAQYAECRAQLNALIDWHEGRKKGQQEAGPEKR